MPLPLSELPPPIPNRRKRIAPMIAEMIPIKSPKIPKSPVAVGAVAVIGCETGGTAEGPIGGEGGVTGGARGGATGGATGGTAEGPIGGDGGVTGGATGEVTG